MLLDVHESIPQSWMESLLPDREVLSCDPSLGLASSCRQKPCAHMCWAQSIHVCHRQEWENILALGRFSFLCPLLNCSHWLRWICVVPYPVDSSVLVSSWSSTDGVHIIHYWEGPFSFPQAEKSWGGISAPSAALQRPEKHRKSLNGNREYPLQCVSGVQSRLRKERLIFQRQGGPWMCWCVLWSGNPVQQEWWTQVFCSTIFFPLAGGDREQKWLESSQFQ